MDKTRSPPKIKPLPNKLKGENKVTYDDGDLRLCRECQVCYLYETEVQDYDCTEVGEPEINLEEKAWKQSELPESEIDASASLESAALCLGV